MGRPEPQISNKWEARLAGGRMEEQVAALRALCEAVPKRERRGTNLHIHTNESFSVFRSPSEAVWQAVREGVAVFGINDHYTVAGHEEFRRACEVARIPATFSMEAVAMDREAEWRGELTNDPGNPGRTYLCAKGVTCVPADDSPAMRRLMTMRAALERRNRAMTGKAADLLRERVGIEGLTWDEVVALTPRGNVTERHVAKAVLARLMEAANRAREREDTSRKEKGKKGEREKEEAFVAEEASERSTLMSLVERCCGAEPPGENDAALQNFIRAKLLKAGSPCYVEEAPDAFLSLEDMRDLFLAFGAIPTYPVLGNPVTEAERDIERLLDRLESIRIFAIEVIPQRNTRERLAEIIAAARRRNWPVFNGTEHNTAEAAPLLHPLSLDSEFLPWFEASASVLLGHQAEAAAGRAGFVNGRGVPVIADAAERLGHFGSAGRRVWQAAAGRAMRM